MRRFSSILIAGLGLLATATPALAHHAFSAEFDANKPVNLEGKIVKVELVNPHAWIHVEVKKPDGTTETWAIEGGTPNTLQRRGITRDSITGNPIVKVSGYRSKDGSLKANGRNITFSDGRTLFLGSSGTGAPRDGADTTEPPK